MAVGAGVGLVGDGVMGSSVGGEDCDDELEVLEVLEDLGGGEGILTLEDGGSECNCCWDGEVDMEMSCWERNVWRAGAAPGAEDVPSISCLSEEEAILPSVGSNLELIVYTVTCIPACDQHKTRP